MQALSARYTVLVGNYGSGKTELALAIARSLRKEQKGRIAMVDLDIVNPYFRSAEKSDLLKQEGIEVFMPSFAMSTVDIPALPPEIQGVFEQDFERVVIDVGGDEVGATALARYAPYIKPLRDQMKVLYVVNTYRPLSEDVEDIVEMFSLVERQGRLRPDFLVNNCNLQEDTAVADLIDAQAMLEEVSGKLSVPIGLVSGMPRLKDALPPAMQEIYFGFTPIMKPGWLEG